MNVSQRGFTLIELMIVVTIVAILAAIGYPSYTQFVKRSARADAKAGLLQNAQFLERNFTVANSYAGDSAGNAIDDAALPVSVSPRDGTAKYSFTVAPAASSFTLSAVPEGVMTGDECGTLTLTSTGVKGTMGGSLSPAECWNH